MTPQIVPFTIVESSGERSRPRKGIARSSPGAGQCGFLLGCSKHIQQKHTHDQPN